MSMRTTLRGCSLTKIRGTIGTADDELIDGIRARFRQEAEEGDWDDEPEDQAALAAVAAKLRGQPSTDLDDERYVGYLAMMSLAARVDGDRRPLTKFEVKHFFWLELSQTYANVIGRDAELFRYLEEGRPLFGRRTNSECFYTWFEREEAIRLREAAKRIAALPDVIDDIVEILTGDEDGVVGCIDTILDAGYDVLAVTT